MSFSDVTSTIERIMHLKLFELNNTDITPSSLIMFLAVFLIFAIASKIARSILGSQILGRMKIEEGTSYNLLRIAHYLIMVLGAFVASQFIGIDLTGLAVVFGLLSVGIGFGLQNVTSNFIAGIILLLERPISVGDRVTVGNTEGDVTAINIRSTTIRTLNHIAIIVPNSEFVSSQVINWTHGDEKIRLDIDVGVSYNSNLDDVVDSLYQAARENPEVLVDPSPDVLHLGFGDSAWNMRLRVWIEDPKRHIIVRSAINSAIVGKFRQNGVEIPFPQRDLHVRSPLPVPISR